MRMAQRLNNSFFLSIMNLLHNHLHNHRLAEDCHAFHAGALVYSILEATQTKLISFELSVYISGFLFQYFKLQTSQKFCILKWFFWFIYIFICTFFFNNFPFHCSNLFALTVHQLPTVDKESQRSVAVTFTLHGQVNYCALQDISPK